LRWPIFFPGAETPRDRDNPENGWENFPKTKSVSFQRLRNTATTLSDGDKRLVLAMIRKMATVIPPPPAQGPTAALRVLNSIPKLIKREFGG